ncbi:MAG TPA: PDZ domain-containing protein [Verrucomicrobiae bacterium]|nr:PDZ domain-containing protein [Verrucomicrobiae bacterium]
MSPQVITTSAWLWLAVGATTAPVAASAAPPSSPTPSAASPSAAADSLKALWGSRLLHALVIADVAAGSPAEKAGLRIGDVLESYGGTTIDDVPSIEDFAAGLKNAARKGPVAVKIRRFDFQAGPPRTLTLEVRLSEDPQARVGLAVHPAVFFVDLLAEGAAGKAGVKPWDCIDAVEGEELSEHPRLSDFESHVLTLKNKDGNVRVTIGRWRPAPEGETPKIGLDREREVVLPVPGS